MKCIELLILLIIGVVTPNLIVDVINIDEQRWKVVNSNQSIILDAKVPGGIYSLIEDDQREYLFYEFNDMKFRWVAYENWTYFTDFEVKGSDYKSKYIFLVLHGVDTVSQIFINDKFIGSTENMFIRYRFNIKQAVKIGINKLYINFTSPITESKRQAALLPYKIPSECWPNVYHGECHINKLRKMQASFAWDWGPAFPSVGLWKPVEIELNEGIVLRSVGTFLTTENDNWRLTARAWFDLEESKQGILGATLHIPGDGRIKREIEVTIPMTTKEAQIRLLIPKSKVKLWWPNGYGSQTLYHLTVYFKLNGRIVDRNSVKIGFRTVEIVQQPVDESTSKGRTFYLKVNNEPIFAKGSNWIPSDILPENTAIEERVTRLLKAAVDANFNMLRVWGGGVYESELFYSLCDEYGILIWHDLMFACNMYPSAAGYLQLVKTEIEQQVKRLQHHPSIAVWAGNNENEVALKQNWYSTASNFSLYKSDYIKLYVDTIKPIIQTLDPQRPYVTSSPSNGIDTIREGYVAMDPQSNLYGDVHYYNYIGNLWDWRVFPTPRFTSEYGVQSLPMFSTLINAMNVTNAVWDSEVLRWKQHSPLRYLPILLQSQMNLPGATTLKDIIYLSQINQAMSIKTETEHYRRMKSVLLPTGEGLTMGALYWQLNDVWEAPSWSSIDFLGKWKMLHYFAKSFFNSVIVSPMVESDDTLSIFLVSDLLIPIKQATLFIDVYKWNSFVPISSQRHQIYIGPNQSKDVLKGNLTYFLGTCQNRTECFLTFSADIHDDLQLKISVPQNYIFPVPLKSAKFPCANVKIEKFVLENKFEGSLTLTTDQIALFVWIECSGARGESGIAFSDNGFHMLEKEKVIKVTSKFPIDQATFAAGLSITNLKSKYE